MENKHPGRARPKPNAKAFQTKASEIEVDDSQLKKAISENTSQKSLKTNVADNEGIPTDEANGGSTLPN